MLKKTKLKITGMHCKSCEMLIEDELLKVKGVKNVNVSQPKGIAYVEHTGTLDQKAVACAVEEAGYYLNTESENSKAPWFSEDPDDYSSLAVSLLIVMFAFLFLKSSNFELSVGNDMSSLPVVFLIGLTAGISTCMALVGGLVLGISAKFAQKHPWASPTEKFKPHLFFNIGRVLSFFVFGALAGALGSFFTVSTSITGLLSVFAGLAMFFMGLQLIQISPRLTGITLTLPKFISRSLGVNTVKNTEYSNKNAGILGALTFFLPCGFTQAVQLYAISTGNPLTASLTLGVFALGTMPGLLGIGGLTSIVKGAFGRAFFRVIGLIVMSLAIFNISNGVNLSGLNNISLAKQDSKNTVLGANNTEKNSGNNEKVVAKATYSVEDDMVPSKFTFKNGQKVRLEVQALEDGYGCMGSLYIAGIMKAPVLFQKGKTEVIEFTAKTGKYTIACAMGIPRGTIQVN